MRIPFLPTFDVIRKDDGVILRYFGTDAPDGMTVKGKRKNYADITLTGDAAAYVGNLIDSATGDTPNPESIGTILNAYAVGYLDIPVDAGHPGRKAERGVTLADLVALSADLTAATDAPDAPKARK